MYKFTNGIVVFDEETKNNYLKAGFVLVEEPKKEEAIEGQINIDEAIEEENEDKENDRVIDKKPRTSKRISE